MPPTEVNGLPGRCNLGKWWRTIRPLLFCTGNLYVSVYFLFGASESAGCFCISFPLIAEWRVLLPVLDIILPSSFTDMYECNLSTKHRLMRVLILFSLVSCPLMNWPECEGESEFWLVLKFERVYPPAGVYNKETSYFVDRFWQQSLFQNCFHSDLARYSSSHCLVPQCFLLIV